MSKQTKHQLEENKKEPKRRKFELVEPGWGEDKSIILNKKREQVTNPHTSSTILLPLLIPSNNSPEAAQSPYSSPDFTQIQQPSNPFENRGTPRIKTGDIREFIKSRTQTPATVNKPETEQEQEEESKITSTEQPGSDEKQCNFRREMGEAENWSTRMDLQQESKMDLPSWRAGSL